MAGRRPEEAVVDGYDLLAMLAPLLMVIAIWLVYRLGLGSRISNRTAVLLGVAVWVPLLASIALIPSLVSFD